MHQKKTHLHAVTKLPRLAQGELDCTELVGIQCILLALDLFGIRLINAQRQIPWKTSFPIFFLAR